MRDFLINEKNISLMKLKDNKDFNVKRLLKNPNLSQSQSICFGTVFENFIRDLIKSKEHSIRQEKLVDINFTGTKTNKGKKDIDICFIIYPNMYYFESKLNLDLDSEKSKATDDKVSDIHNFLVNENKGINIISGVLTGWYENERGLPNKLKSKVFFMKDFFEILDIQTTKEEYYSLLEEFGRMLK
jgi:hypothetical protein